MPDIYRNPEEVIVTFHLGLLLQELIVSGFHLHWVLLKLTLMDPTRPSQIRVVLEVFFHTTQATSIFIWTKRYHWTRQSWLRFWPLGKDFSLQMHTGGLPSILSASNHIPPMSYFGLRTIHMFFGDFTKLFMSDQKFDRHISWFILHIRHPGMR